MRSIYLDNNATTVLDPEVLEVMVETSKHPWNASSVHRWGREAKCALKEARDTLAKTLGVSSDSLLFTSGGTESMNMLIKGLYPGSGKILTTRIEHACVEEALLATGQDKLVYVQATRGAPTLEAIEEALTQEVSCMVFSAVYSETGAKLDIKKVAELAYRHRKVLILDGVALLGKELFTLPLGVQGMGFSSHKLHGPKGAGLVYLARGAECRPLLVGGHQEKGLRAGTENLPAILGFVKAVEIAYSHLPQLTERLLFLREHFETSLAKLVPLVINGEGERVCNVSNLAFKGVEGETLLLALDRASIYASLGSACASGALEPSRVLLNMSLSRERAKSSLRFSFSRYTTQEEVDEAVETIVGIIERLSSQGL